MQKSISRISLAIIAIVVIAEASALGNFVGVANAQLQPFKCDFKVTKMTIFSSNKTADGITHLSFNIIHTYSGDIEGTRDAAGTQDINLQTGTGHFIALGTANLKILGKGPDKITQASDVTYTGFKDGAMQLEGLMHFYNGQGALKGVEGQGTLKGMSIPGRGGNGTIVGQVRFGPEVVETTSPISYGILGIGIVLIAASAVLYTRKKKV
jgi:hypothetical protein